MFLRWFAKIVCFGTLFLIFVGGMVKSTESGLAVPDWPLSYGMLFPPMVGGVFYEHGHRMVAALVGFLTLGLTISLGYLEKRRWLKNLGFAALAVVILQGVLGGITVLFFLPDPVSIAHGFLAQTFFVLTIIIAYSLSEERKRREAETTRFPLKVIHVNIVFVVLIFTQLLIGAIMRHTESGLAIPDFPTMGGEWFPIGSAKALAWINMWRFETDLPPVSQGQVFIHWIHRAFAFVILIAVIVLGLINLRDQTSRLVHKTALFLIGGIGLQIFLGIVTVLSHKEPIVTSLHVAVGAAVLGISVLLVLRTSPLSWGEFKKIA